MNSSFHLLAFAGSVAQNATLAQIPRITDVYFPNSTDGYYPQGNFRVWAGYAQIPNGTAARINTPLLRIPQYPRLSYIDTATDPPNLPPVNVWGDNGPMLKLNDPVNVEVSRTGAGAGTCGALLWCGPGHPSPSSGEIRTALATSTVTCTTSVWSQGTITFTDTLPSGTYDIVGMACYGTNLLAARFIFPNGMMRPGALAQQTVTEYGWDNFRYGLAGTWGTFLNTAPPVVEFLSYGACTAQSIYIDLIKRS